MVRVAKNKFNEIFGCFRIYCNKCHNICLIILFDTSQKILKSFS